MLYRKISKKIEEHFANFANQILLIDGARQIGKTYIIRYSGKKCFTNFVEINMIEDFLGDKSFENVNNINDFYFQLSAKAGNKLDKKENTLVFIDEIQVYPKLLTLLKFLQQDNKYTFIASGSLLGITLANSLSIPMGSVKKLKMYPLDFEEFLLANNFNSDAINTIRNKFNNKESLDENTHNRILDLFKKYLLVGGLPEAVNIWVENKNISTIRDVQKQIHEFYGDDASKYDRDRNLMIKSIYDMLPSNMENKKKRIIANKIENVKGKTLDNYKDEFEYLVNSGIALSVHAISNPSFPLIQSARKNLVKLYMNDCGLLSCLLYGNNINAVLQDNNSINLGSLYETVVASELKAHDHELYYYDNRNNGEVDYLIDDYDNLSILPIEVKSGRDYTIHSALNKLLNVEDYHINEGVVLSNSREVYKKNNVLYLPIYYVMFI